MQIILLTIGIVAALMGGMAVGVIFSNKPLRGSCGGREAGSCACDDAGTPGACKSDADPASIVLDGEFKAPGEIMQLRKG